MTSENSIKGFIIPSNLEGYSNTINNAIYLNTKN